MLIVQRRVRQATLDKTSFTVSLISILFTFLLTHTRADAQGQMATDQTPNGGGSVYVDSSNTSGTEDGTSQHPYNTVTEGIAVANGNTVWIRAGFYNERLTVNRLMSLRSNGGNVTIGKAAPPPIYRIYLPLAL